MGLLPDSIEVVPAGRRRRVPEAVVQELKRLKGLYDGFQYRELARIFPKGLAEVPELPEEASGAVQSLWRDWRRTRQ